jgi:hypothetical protein
VQGVKQGGLISEEMYGYLILIWMEEKVEGSIFLMGIINMFTQEEGKIEGKEEDALSFLRLGVSEDIVV